jgi:hypothetical protein
VKIFTEKKEKLADGYKCVGLGSVTRRTAVITVKSHCAITNEMFVQKTGLQLV